MCTERHSTVITLALAAFAFSVGANAQARIARMPQPVAGSLSVPASAALAAPDLVVRAPHANPARVPAIPPITLGLPSIAEPGPPTFDACPNDRGTLGVPGVGCSRASWWR